MEELLEPPALIGQGSAERGGGGGDWLGVSMLAEKGRDRRVGGAMLLLHAGNRCETEADEVMKRRRESCTCSHPVALLVRNSIGPDWLHRFHYYFVFRLQEVKWILCQFCVNFSGRTVVRVPSQQQRRWRQEAAGGAGLFLILYFSWPLPPL